MRKMLCMFVALLALIVKFNPSQSQSTSTCTTYAFESSNVTNTTPKTTFKSCVDLKLLSSFLHWTYNPANATLKIAYRHPGLGSATSRWVTWAINPIGKGMVGAQCLVAYRSPKDGSMVVYTSPISGYGTDLSKGDLSFNVTELSAVSLNDEIIIFATLEVPKNATVLHQVWQDGPLLSDGTLQVHTTSGPNVLSMGSLNILSGVDSPADGGIGSTLKNIHGVLNAVSWGMLMPAGAIIARYMRVFPAADPAWFYLHAGCQMSAYGVGVAGWVTGLSLGSKSEGVEHSLHRNIGITLFCFGTLQMFAFLIRPTKEHKYRFYWNIYHHSIGYSTIILSIVNILEGFEILNPADFWKQAYIGVIVSLASIAALLEAFTWYVVVRRKNAQVRGNGNKSGQHAPNGAYFA